MNIIKKPKNKESATMIERGLGDIQWHTMRIKVFKLKYKVVETEESYKCFRVKRDEEE